MSEASQTAKRLLASTTLFHHPAMHPPTAITTNASNTGIGAVLEQRIQAAWKPFAFFSCHLSPAKSRYYFDCELLAMHAAIRHFCHVHKKSDPLSACQSRHLAAIADIQHVNGKANVVADALSRQPVPLPDADLSTTVLLSQPTDDDVPDPAELLDTRVTQCARNGNF